MPATPARTSRNSNSSVKFSNLPQNVVHGILQHMNARTAARFATVAKEYSANARKRTKAATNAQRASIQAGISKVARNLAGVLLLAAKRIQMGQIDPDAQFYRTVSGFGKVGVKIRDWAGEVSIIRLHTQWGWAPVVANWGGPRLVLTPAFGAKHEFAFWAKDHYPELQRSLFGRVMQEASAARKWLVRAAFLRAIDMYNEKPLVMNARER